MESTSNETFKKQNIKPGLYIISTPIGNLDDITFRAINILKNSNLILCEDTRISYNLLKKYDIKTTMMSNHKFNEKKNLNKILENLKKNTILSLISDAGTPLISDPGQLLVNECIKHNISVFPIPGPSAVTSAVSVSGYNDKYLFYGFVPVSEKHIEKDLKNLSNFPYSIVFFVSSKKINKFIKYLKIFFNERKILIAREMTKFYEEYIRSTVKSLKFFSKMPKGELTVVVSGKNNDKKSLILINESVKKEMKEMLKKYSSKDVASFMSKRENISKKIIYDYCLKLKI